MESFQETGRWRRTLVVFDNISEVVFAGVVRFSYAHRVVGEVDIAVIALGSY